VGHFTASLIFTPYLLFEKDDSPSDIRKIYGQTEPAGPIDYAPAKQICFHRPGTPVKFCGVFSTLKYMVTELKLTEVGHVWISGYEIYYQSGGQFFKEFVPWAYRISLSSSGN
jgi:hypothetical protein